MRRRDFNGFWTGTMDQDLPWLLKEDGKYGVVHFGALTSAFCLHAQGEAALFHGCRAADQSLLN